MFLVDDFAEFYYLFGAGAALYAGVSVWAAQKKKGGTSRFGHSLKKLEGNDGIILSQHHQLSFLKSKENVIVIAPTGSQKTWNVILPNLLTNHLPKSSIVISDIKGELWDKTSEYQRSIGRIPMKFNPLGKENGIKYNILANCEDTTEIRQIATKILSNGSTGIKQQMGGSGGGSEATWINMAVPLLTAALIYVKDGKKGTITDAVKLLINVKMAKLQVLFGMSNNEDIKEQWNIFASANGCDEEIAGIYSTLLTNIQLFTDHYLIQNTALSDFTPELLRQKPIALYVQYSASKSSYLAPYLSVFYSQLIDHIIECQGLPIAFFLDEFQNLGHVPFFTDTVSYARAANVIFVLSIQSINKLFTIYGADNVKNMLQNIKTKLVMDSISEAATLDYISSLCGYTTIIDNVKIKAKLLEEDEIRRLKQNTVLIIAHNCLPVKDKKYFIPY